MNRGVWMPFNRHRETTLRQGHVFDENSVPGHRELLDGMGAEREG